MRTPVVLIATLLLTATAASAAPRSLSTGEQPQTVELPTHKVQVLEAPKVELAPPAPAASAQIEPAPAQTGPVQTPTPEPKTTETAPAEVKPVVTAPVETKPAETKPVQAAPVTETKPVKQAQRKSQQRQVSVEQRVHRELRSIERRIGFGLSIGSAFGYSLAGAPYYW